MNATPRVHWQTLALAALLVCVTLLAYLPAIHGTFLIDDGVNVTKPELRSLQGLGRIWSELGVTQQYYPFLYSVFWIEHRLWGDASTGYHLVNLLEHLVAAGLLIAIARRLALPGAWFAGFVFALHPVGVESVAWIAEQKNTLSTALFLGSALAYLHFDESRRPRLYVFALLLFVLALLSKTVTATLPAALLVVFWWKRGRLDGKHDVLPLAPWFVLGVGMGLFSAWVERRFVGAHGDDFALNFVERTLVASQGVCFYFGKLLWPTNLTFMYPRFDVNVATWWQYLFVIAILAVVITAVVLARRQRGLLATILLFGGLLFPMLGFFDIYWFRISYVADHFLYLPSVALIVPLAAALTLGGQRNPRIDRWVHPLVCATLLAALGALTWRQSGIYRDYRTLCRETLARNPGAWMLHHNLGVEIAEEPGRLPEAIAHFQETLRLKPNFSEAHFNLAQAWMRVPGKLSDAIAEFEETIRLEPGDTAARFNLAEAYFNLGNSHANAGRRTEALHAFDSALRLAPESVEAHYNRACVLAMIPGRAADAKTAFETVLRLKPDFAPAAQRLKELR